MKKQLSNQILKRLDTFGLSTNEKENIDPGERIVSLLAKLVTIQKFKKN